MRTGKLRVVGARKAVDSGWVPRMKIAGAKRVLRVLRVMDHRHLGRTWVGAHQNQVIYAVWQHREATEADIPVAFVQPWIDERGVA